MHYQSHASLSMLWVKILFCLCVAVFGIGSMIFSGLRFGQFFELNMNSSCFNLMRGVTPIALMVFVFLQLYFIFLNAKVKKVAHKSQA